MIEWKKYDPKNPPESGKKYLITNGKYITTATRSKPSEYVDSWVSNVTHYAEINLPK